MSVFDLLSPSSVVSLGGIAFMVIEKQIDSCKRFYVLKVSWRTKLNVTFSVESGGNGEL